LPADLFISAGDLTFSLCLNRLYQHNDAAGGGFNILYGVSRPAVLCVVLNADPGKTKILQNIEVVADLAPSVILARNEYQNIQETDILGEEMNDLEGKFYSTFKRDRLTPGPDGINTLEGALLRGQHMRAEVTKIMLQWDNHDKSCDLRLVNIGYTLSVGHSF
jgi:hypothetical protein